MPNRTRTKSSRGTSSTANASNPSKDDGLLGVWPNIVALLDCDARFTAEQMPDDLTERTAAQIAAMRAAAVPANLHEADAATLDALLLARESGGASLLPADLAERRTGVEAVLALLDRDAVSSADQNHGAERDESPADLTARTLETIQAARQRERFAEQIDMLRQGPPSAGVSLRQVLSAAAILLLGVTLLLPIMDRAQNSSMQAACASNLSLAGRAFGAYAADHTGVFPRAASLPGASWWNVGRPDAVTRDGKVQSNSAHLYLLVRGGYIPAEELACQGNAEALRDNQMTVRQLDWSSPVSVSYSYQNQFTPQVLRADEASPSLAVLADKNPLFVPRGGRLVFDADAKITDASRQHGGAGQNALRIDGSAAWTIMPNFGTGYGQAMQDQPDIFWAVQSKRADHRYTGRELPDGVNLDAFLVP